MGKPAPPGYIAGLGRGATGFTTRSDIGPAREASLASLAKDQDNRDNAGDDEQRFNDDPDNETGLFNSLPYEADDEEADRIYAAVDEAMNMRRAKQRAAKEKELKAKLAIERPKITEQFADAKRELSKLSAGDWEGIPEVTNLSRRKTKKDLGRERFVPVPDSVLAGAKAQVETTSTVQSADGTRTEMSGIRTDFVEMGAARDRVLGVKLDQVSADSTSGQTTVDPKGYLTDLNSMIPKSEADIGDIKKTRMLLTSLTKTNPGHAPAWIAAARFEEMTGNLVQARALIAQGCEFCPKREDVWLEAARLNTLDNAKVILANAVRHVPDSVKVWLHASRLESDVIAQKRVLRRALEFIPNSVTIWRAAIALEENQSDAVILVRRAVECVPLSVDMWLTLAKLETHENARKVLNKARKTIPTSHEIWIAAAMLEEAQSQEGEEEKARKTVDMIVSRAIDKLQEAGTSLSREKWLDEAVACEKQEAVMTCEAIVKNTIGLGLEPEDRKSVWIQDAENCLANGHVSTARAIYANAVTALPTKRSLWEGAAFLELKHGTPASVLALLERAVAAVPHAESLWLMSAKTKWQQLNDLPGARHTLSRAFQANPSSSAIWLAAVKLEQETGDHVKAQQFLTHARAKAGGEPKVWLKSAVLERILGNLDRSIELARMALDRFPTFWKLWLVWAQVEEQMGNIAGARDVYANANKRVPACVHVWTSAAALEERAGVPFRARAVLDRARLMNPKNAELWCATVSMEHRAGNAAMARSQLARALQDCPTSGKLWALAIVLESRPQRRARSLDALKACGESDPHVVLAVARVFWAERKMDKARGWLARATQADPDCGDAWAYWLRFEMENGSEASREEVMNKFLGADPRHGDMWPRAVKDIANVGKLKEEVLRLVAAEVPTSV
ncbi:PRP1 splicing factor, N-terminal-domain-containing protein [Catenaria anguillulae PL171]|uniref:PRP1 splicing factor, N-terminal-domain-containing protein n=1 Tax=Catenaria anguillulae PL171 TaxID=765915 RepID=A0A1Y2HMW3_9FUNG|nr:PRP1 splicing factor, N-terminal-domain-containing protein [Catenaria anguillulae PL171]